MHPMKLRSRFAASAGGLAILLVGCAGEESGAAQDTVSEVTAFEGARLILGDGGQPIEDGVLLVADGRLIEVGTRGGVQVPTEAVRIDLTGKTVMPAFVDTHKHLGSARETLTDQLQHLAYYGVGVATSLGQDDGDLAFQIRAETIPDAARFRTAGRGITMSEPGRSEVPYWITTEEEARTAVRELAEREVDLVKIWVDDRNGQYEKMSPELYGAIIDEAHRFGLRVTAHIFALDDAKGLLRAGVDAFAHGIRDQDVDDEVIALFQDHPEVVLVPNMPGRGVAEDLSWLSGTVPPVELQEMQAASRDNPDAQEAFGIQARNLARLNDAGVRIAFGTDGSTPWSHHLEMADMVAAGMTPAEVIVAATRTSAELLQIDEVGTLEPGKSADFLVLDANPLDDITNTRRINAVYLRGAQVDREALGARWMAASSTEEA
ncbi:MAG: amidohydrolase family protein [Gemmatimonas sp.]|nr:amidohydrolase family protein [Gemmatimonas sp.]